MLPRAFSMALLLAALTGCLTPPASTNGADAAHTAIAGWTLDCHLGDAEKALNASWPQSCVARASHAPGQKQEIWLAANPKDEDNVVIGSKDLNPASSMKCVWNGLAVTKDGGKTWKDVTIGGTYASRAPTSPFFGYSCNTDPMLAFTKDGNVHYVVEMYNFAGQDGYGPLPPDPRNGRGLVQPGWDLVLATSTDGGLTWPDSNVVDLLRGDGVGVENDYSRMTVSPKTGSIAVMINTFRGAGSQGLLPQADTQTQYNACSVIVSRDGGKTADTPVEAVGPDTLVGGADCRTISAAPDGTLVILGEKDDLIWSSRSTDDGKTWDAPIFSSFKRTAIPSPFNESKYRTGTGVEAVYDTSAGPRKGTLYLITAEKAQDEADIFLRWSTDNGKTWAQGFQVNNGPAGSHQFMPNGVVASDGSLHVFYMDKSYDPAHTLIDITHFVMSPDGNTTRNERVTTVSWDGELGKHQENFPFIGDYIGAGASGKSVWAGFPDTTPGISVIAAARAQLS